MNTMNTNIIPNIRTCVTIIGLVSLYQVYDYITHLDDKYHYNISKINDTISSIKNDFQKLELEHINLKNDFIILLNKIKYLESNLYTPTFMSTSPSRAAGNGFTCINMEEYLDSSKNDIDKNKEETRSRSKSVPWDTTIRTIFG